MKRIKPVKNVTLVEKFTPDGLPSIIARAVDPTLEITGLARTRVASRLGDGEASFLSRYRCALGAIVPGVDL